MCCQPDGLPSFLQRRSLDERARQPRHNRLPPPFSPSGSVDLQVVFRGSRCLCTCWELKRWDSPHATMGIISLIPGLLIALGAACLGIQARSTVTLKANMAPSINVHRLSYTKNLIYASNVNTDGIQISSLQIPNRQREEMFPSIWF